MINNTEDTETNNVTTLVFEENPLYEIETNISMPNPNGKNAWLNLLQVGESFLIPENVGAMHREKDRLMKALVYQGMKGASRISEEGIRIWRTA